MPLSDPSRPQRRALHWIAFLVPFFLVTYTLSNYVASHLANAPSIAFAWERQIPFLAWTIVPYWSTDLLFPISLLICSTKHELDTHAKRLIAVQLISVAGFLLFPLHFSFERPETHGLFGNLFTLLMGFDKPFNQAPSLHLGIGAVLWARYSAHLTGISRLLMQAWLVLVGLSTLTTYQHHFIDLPTGIAAGLWAIGLFPMSSHPARQLSLAYSIASVLLASLAWKCSGAATLLYWPALALIVPATAYATNTPALFVKSNRFMTLFLAPYLAFVWINSRLWTRHQPAVQHIASGVWIGRAPGRLSSPSSNFRSVVDVTAELPARTGGILYRAVPMLDLIPPEPHQLQSAIKAIENLTDYRPTLVFCALGYSRSAAAIAAWLLHTQQAPCTDAAVSLIRSQRPHIVLGPGHLANIEKVPNVL